MTISSTTVKNSYSGDNTTATFSYTFKIFADSDLHSESDIQSCAFTENINTRENKVVCNFIFVSF